MHFALCEGAVYEPATNYLMISNVQNTKMKS